jgi:hypothetical protein
MVRIVMDIRMVDGKPPGSRLLTSRFADVENYDQVEQIAREMRTHFDQVVAENPAARAVADILARPEPQNPFEGTMGFAMEQLGRTASDSMDKIIASSLKVR